MNATLCDVRKKTAITSFAASITISLILFNAAHAAENRESMAAFPDRWMIRAGAYVVDGTNTQFSINSSTGSGLGTTIDFEKDLGGEDGDTIPRIDAYYRFNKKHRIDFTAFSVDRKGEATLDIDITIDDTNYVINETVLSKIEYTLYKLGYSYSFYHSPKVELSLSAGLNITSYDLRFQDDTGSKVETTGVTVPLPMFGLRLGYAISPKWHVRYVTEAFFIDLSDEYRGALLNYELNTEYRLTKNFAIGGGIARLGINAEIDDDDWRGKVSDTYRGFTVFGTVYF